MPNRYRVPLTPPPHRRVWRLFQANMRDAVLLLRDTWQPLAGFGFCFFAGAWFLHTFYRSPGGERLSFGEAFYATFLLIVFESNLEFPPDQLWWVGLSFFALPLVGLVLLAQGALNFGLLLLDKRNRAEAWQMALASTYRNHVIVCGLGKVGFRVVQELRAIRSDIVVIENRSDAPFVELVRAQDIPVIIGDARQVETLEAAGLQHCVSVTIVTSDDLTNLDIALTARAARTDSHIVMRVFSDALAAKLETAFGIKTAFSTSLLAAPTFAAASVSQTISHALHVRGHLLSTSEMVVERGGGLDGKLIGQLEQKYDVTAVLLNTGTVDELRPRGDYRLVPGDLLVVLGDLDTLLKLRNLNSQPDEDPLGVAGRHGMLSLFRQRRTARPGTAPLNAEALRGPAAMLDAYEARVTRPRTGPLHPPGCAQCHATLHPQARYCHECGSQVPAEPAAG